MWSSHAGSEVALDSTRAVPYNLILRLRLVLEAMIEILESPLDVRSELATQGAEHVDIALAALLNAEYPENPIDSSLTPAEVDQAILDCSEALDILAQDTSFYRSAALYNETVATLEDMLADLQAMN
jgi:hypothetical protein